MFVRITASFLVLGLMASPVLAQSRWAVEAKERAARHQMDQAVREAEHPGTPANTTTAAATPAPAAPAEQAAAAPAPAEPAAATPAPAH